MNNHANEMRDTSKTKIHTLKRIILNDARAALEIAKGERPRFCPL